MTKIIYEIIEHDGGWAYKVGTTYSETFHSRDDALAAARIAAAEQQVAGSSEGTGHTRSPLVPSGSRLVVSTATVPDLSNRSVRLQTELSTCSQLSRTSNR